MWQCHYVGCTSRPHFLRRVVCGTWVAHFQLLFQISKSHEGQPELAATLFHLDSRKGLSTYSPTLLSSAACSMCIAWASLEHEFGDGWGGWQGLLDFGLPLNELWNCGLVRTFFFLYSLCLCIVKGLLFLSLASSC